MRTKRFFLQPIFQTHFFFACLVAFAVFSLFLTKAQAAEECPCKADQDELACVQEKQNCWQSKIGQKKQEANTLANLISTINGKVMVQELQIKQTQLEIQQLVKDISQLGERISGLNVSLDHLTNTLILRVRASYKRRSANPLSVLLISDSVGSFFSQFKYLQLTQNHTAELMAKAENQKVDFDQQKELKEKKQKEVDQKRVQLQKQQNELTQQRADQQTLLQQTKNDEARYQAELAKTLAELGAIQSIVAGDGNETKVRDVTQGDEIANIIVGASTCSTGTHLHFEVVKNNAHQNPAQYLKSISAVWNNSPDGSFDLTGDWEWPVPNPARISQGYGMTWYARVKRSYGGAPHTGIDMVSKDSGNYQVKAVKPGTLFRGSISCGKGLLRYVKVVHKDSDLSTYYLHVNY